MATNFAFQLLKSGISGNGKISFCNFNTVSVKPLVLKGNQIIQWFLNRE